MSSVMLSPSARTFVRRDPSSAVAVSAQNDYREQGYDERATGAVSYDFAQVVDNGADE